MSESQAAKVNCREIADFGEMLRCFRRRQMLTQAALAERADLGINTISSWERGERTRPHESSLKLLAEALELDAEDREALAGSRPGYLRQVPQLLPFPATSFLGREVLVRQAIDLVVRPDVRLLTLTGAGGIGKTRLALRVAEEVTETFIDGVYFVDLSGLRDQSLVPGAIAQVLGVHVPGGRSIESALLERCVNRQMLLVLDNFEQILSASTFVDQLLGECPRLSVLATSRERLALSREQVFVVGAMALPPSDRTSDLETIAASEAVQLFVRRAQAAKPTFELNDENAEDVLQICIGLDGIPLAIELAAARIPHVGSPRFLRERLHQRLTWLSSGLRDQTNRHQTMRAAIDWSYEALESDEQQMFRRLAVFSGGFSIDSAESTIRFVEQGFGRQDLGPAESECHESSSVLDGISSLVDRNLVQVYDGPDGGTRYRMLETIREYGLERLEDCDERNAAQMAHSMAFLALARRVHPHLKGSEPAQWLDLLEQEHENMRSALSWTTARERSLADVGLQIAVELWYFWKLRGYHSEAEDWLSTSLAAGDPKPSPSRADALIFLGHSLEEEKSRSCYRQALAMYRELLDARSEAGALSCLGMIAEQEGKYEDARRLHEQSLDIFREVGRPDDIAQAYYQLGVVASRAGELAAAQKYFDEARSRWQQAGHSGSVGNTLVELARVARRLGGYAEAEDLLGWSMELFTKNSMVSEQITVTSEFGVLALTSGDLERAGEYFRESLRLQESLSLSDVWAVTPVEGIASVAISRLQTQFGIELWGAATAWRERNGQIRTLEESAALTQDKGIALTQLGRSAFDRSWQKGYERTTLTQAVTMARALEVQRSPTAPDERAEARDAIAGLQDRERQILCLIAQGFSDEQIAEELAVSVRTVETDVKSIFHAISVDNRSAAAALAVRSSACTGQPTERC